MEARRSRVARAPSCSDAEGALDLGGTAPQAARHRRRHPRIQQESPIYPGDVGWASARPVPATLTAAVQAAVDGFASAPRDLAVCVQDPVAADRGGRRDATPPCQLRRESWVPARSR